MKYNSKSNRPGSKLTTALEQEAPVSSKPKTFGRVVFLALAAAGLVAIIGCQTQSIPSFTSGGYPTPSAVNNTNRVDQFQNSSTIPNQAYINYYLFELNNPPTYTLKNGWHPFFPPSQQPSGVTVINNFKSLAGVSVGSVQGATGSGMGANGEDFAFQEMGAVTDLGDFEYPSLDLQAQFEAGQFYDASPWKGVKFMMKVAADDTAPHRTFSIPVYQTQAVPGGGGCTAGPRLCYDHFAADYSAGTGGQWKQFSYLFSDLHQLVAGAIPNPPTLSGLNLQQVLWLQWEEGRNNSPGACTVDVWLDDIEFF